MSDLSESTTVPPAAGAPPESLVWGQLVSAIEAAVAATVAPLHGEPVSQSYALRGSVPRKEPGQGPLRANEVYIRLENKIYGPVAKPDLGSLLGSGTLTGYEAASTDLVRWTPLAYHPKMVMSETLDPDATHQVLAGLSDLPAPSRKSWIDAVESASKEPPLAAVLKRRKGKAPKGAGLNLPLVGDLEKESMEEVFERITTDQNRLMAASSVSRQKSGPGLGAGLRPGTEQEFDAQMTEPRRRSIESVPVLPGPAPGGEAPPSPEARAPDGFDIDLDVAAPDPLAAPLDRASPEDSSPPAAAQASGPAAASPTRVVLIAIVAMFVALAVYVLLQLQAGSPLPPPLDELVPSSSTPAR